MSNVRVTIVIVTYRSEDTILTALDAAKRCYDKRMVECVVVDNKSPDSTVELIRQHHPWVTLIESSTNLGFGRGCNLGFKYVQTPYVLFLNPDAVIEPESLERLLVFMDERPAAGIVAPAIRDDQGRLQQAGGLPTPVGILKGALRAGQPAGRRPIYPGDEAFQTDWLCGAIILVRCELFQRLNGFDPRFFLYFEETDLCLRTRQAGEELWAVGKAVTYHKCGASVSKETSSPKISGDLAAHFYRSRFYFLSKHYGNPAAALVDLGELFLFGVKDLGKMVAFRGAESQFTMRLHLPLLSSPDPD